MDGQFDYVNLNYLDDISGGDYGFKKELIGIFLKQIPEFVSNLHQFHINKEIENLAKEAHTAKSSVLIFMMEDTGQTLKKIQLLAEDNHMKEIPCLIEKVKKELTCASRELTEYLSGFELVK
jgi:HPt (histidine-containing phosphotransfer) domain-containing protein